MSAEEAKKEEVLDLSNSDVVTKYRVASDIANTALKGVISQCVAGALVSDICAFGDSVVSQQCANVYKTKKVEKGVAFPTCLSVNEVVAHYSPLPGESISLKEGDMVKIDLGCHVDGYIAVTAHTITVGEAEDAAVTGTKADVLRATYTAAEVAMKLIRPGNTNTQVTEAIAKVAEAYGVNATSGTLMHQMKRFVIDGNKTIILREEVDQHVQEVTFEPNEVYAIDVCMSSGEGKPREGEQRTTLFKRAVEQSYRLKMKASRYVYNEINQRFPTLPFSIRAMEDERQARMGVTECLKHNLINAYPVLNERPESIVAHVKLTVLLMPSGTVKITGVQLPDSVSSEKELPEDIVAILNTSSKTKKKRNKKKKAAAAAGEEAPAQE